MTYDEIRLSIAELRAELGGTILTRTQRRATQAEIRRFEQEVAKQVAIITADTYPDDC